MGKRKLEWKDGDFWRYVNLQLQTSRNNNYFVKHDGEVYVFTDLKEGRPVVKKVNGKWVQVGRITRYGVIFIGEGLSYSETLTKDAEERRLRGEPLWERPIL